MSFGLGIEFRASKETTFSLATQTAIGNLGEKATTFLTTSYDGYFSIKGFKYGISSKGIYLLNVGGSQDGELERSFTLQSTDFGEKRRKRFRFIYIELDAEEDGDFIVTVKVDSSKEVSKVFPVKKGRRTVKVPISRDGTTGTFLSVKISSFVNYTIFQIQGKIPTGVVEN